MSLEGVTKFIVDMYAKVPAKAEVLKNLTDNRVVNFVRPHFEKYAQPYLSKAYSAVEPKVREYPYVVGGVAIVAALTILRAYLKK